MESKTVVYEGNVYEIGKGYLFGKSLILGNLTAIDSGPLFPFKFLDLKGMESGAGEIHLVSVDAGTITPAPVELIDGNAYTFKHPAYKKPVVGIYNVGTERFIASNLATLTRTCTGIREMIVKEGD